MAIPAAPSLNPAQAALIPSPSLPLAPQLTHLLTQFTELSLQLFSLLSASTPSASAGTAAIYDELAKLDEKLAGLMAMVEEHQRRWRRIEKLVGEVKATEEGWKKGVQGMHEALAQLQPIITSGAVDRAAILASSSSTLTPQTILSYARLLAPFTSAPPSSLFPPDQQLTGPGAQAMDPSGRTLPMGAIPPFPTEAAMRRGRLQFGAGVDGEEGLVGERGEVGARKDPTAQPPADSLPPRQDPAARLAQHARQEQQQRKAAQQQQQQAEEEEFVFDLDLNPDL
ncbi:hypothetical protein BCR35DRAFT_193082 [Leucosporidium creatinivorum]|uniref:Mediator of RNA polymerase II transcription subunit 4 n=1 Tax=Leucosporidium creatinivorum TaxID=106004 RepID=A0A1Y2FYM5_9BASI|nr:hypothetical protein BCR35DRAFT_193082 [Leucosporidium creatinivorum]